MGATNADWLSYRLQFGDAAEIPPFTANACQSRSLGIRKCSSKRLPLPSRNSFTGYHEDLCFLEEFHLPEGITCMTPYGLQHDSGATAKGR